MNLQDTLGGVSRVIFRLSRALPPLARPRILSFGTDDGRIQKILVINLDRQPARMQRTTRELNRYRTFDGRSLVSIVQRMPAVDARDGRAAAATADVDPNYVTGNQLYVQPDARLLSCFGAEYPVRMTRQEVAVARSHIEAWKIVARGSEDYVLILEDDIWLRSGAGKAIDRGWQGARKRSSRNGGPHLLYFSYLDADGDARGKRDDVVFRPTRGLWHLSGYVLSRDGASRLLRALPIVGPVDMWMNYRFAELDAHALSRPAILQRRDEASDNSYSILPLLARSGVVDADAVRPPTRLDAGPVFAWSAQRQDEGLAMALSMLGFRVRVFDGDEAAIETAELAEVLRTFDAIVDAPLSADAVSTAISAGGKFVVDAGECLPFDVDRLPADRTVEVPAASSGEAQWLPLCDLLQVLPPPAAFPVGARRTWRLFRDDRIRVDGGPQPVEAAPTMDDSPWALPPSSSWQSPRKVSRDDDFGRQVVSVPMTAPSDLIALSAETFPGNLSPFSPAAVTFGDQGTSLVLSGNSARRLGYQSGAFASKDRFQHGRFEVELMAARGSGVVTGFFLHRGSPRQEIDIEILGNDPRSVLVNVYFNAGDAGTEADFGYRGSPSRIDLGFDATEAFHRYVIEWTPQQVSWIVDGSVIHSRGSWDPTPIPHLPMRAHGNVWAPRSITFAGHLDEDSLPSMATFRDLRISEWEPLSSTGGYGSRVVISRPADHPRAGRGAPDPLRGSDGSAPRGRVRQVPRSARRPGAAR
jgi:GR25 family glycosyltransferase involved in LPS biosynthesis